MLTIRSDVPPPTLRNRFRDTLSAMKIGDSVEYQGTANEIAVFRNCVHHTAKALNVKFTTRTDPVSGVTCWRIA